LFRAHSFDAAIDAYKLALSIVPQYLSHEVAIMHSNLAACYIQLSDAEKALQHAEEALSRRPEWNRARARKCTALEMVGGSTDLEAALEGWMALASVGGNEGKDAEIGVARVGRLLEERRKQDVDEVLKGLKDLGKGLLGQFGVDINDFGLKGDGKGGYNLEYKKNGGG
jgi:valyl-tRNA synthetase